MALPGSLFWVRLMPLQEKRVQLWLPMVGQDTAIRFTSPALWDISRLMIRNTPALWLYAVGLIPASIMVRMWRHPYFGRLPISSMPCTWHPMQHLACPIREWIPYAGAYVRFQ